MTGESIRGTNPTEAQRRWFEENYTTATYQLLFNLLRFNLQSRAEIAGAIQKAMYGPIHRREGEYAKLPEPQRQLYLGLATTEVLSNVMMAIEDFGRIILASRRAYKDMPPALVDASPGKSLDVFASLAKQSERELWSVFPFNDPAAYGLKGDDATAFAAYYDGNAVVLKRFVTFVKDFIDRHEFAYMKYKHGMPVVMGLKTAPLAEGIEGVIAIHSRPDDASRVKALLVGPTVMTKLTSLLDTVIRLSRSVVERHLQVAEFLGALPPVLLAGAPSSEGRRFDAYAYGGAFNPTVDRVGRQLLQTMERVNIDVTLNVEAEPDALKGLLDFYRQEWRFG